MKRILSIWLPHWPIERLRQHEPGLVPAELPFALTHSSANGIRLSALNTHAQKEGLSPGMRLTDARAISPRLITRSDEPEQDHAALLRLAHWSTRWGPYANIDVEAGPRSNSPNPDGQPNSLWIDVSGVAHLFGGERALLHDIKTRFDSLDLTTCLGLADTFGAAWALARHAPTKNATTAPTGGTKAALADLPLSALRLKPDIINLLKRLGLYRVSDIYVLPRASLKTRFSSREASNAVLMRLDQALGEIKEPKIALNESPVHETRRPYPEPLIEAQGIETAIQELAVELSDNLAKQHLGARHLTLTIYRTDASTIKINIHQHAPSRTPEPIIRLFHEKLTQYDAGNGIDLITLGAFDCARLSHGQSEFDGAIADHKRNAINGLIDRFENRLGPGTTYRLTPEESHIPERAQSQTGAANHKTSNPPSDARSKEQPVPGLTWPDHAPPRPPLLLKQPEPIAVMAEIPEGPPAQFTWRRTVHRITRAEGPERISPEWWREIGTKETRIRDYYRVEDLHGQRYWLFRDGLYEDNNAPDPTWYMHGLFG